MIVVAQVQTQAQSRAAEKPGKEAHFLGERPWRLAGDWLGRGWGLGTSLRMSSSENFTSLSELPSMMAVLTYGKAGEQTQFMGVADGPGVLHFRWGC